MLLRLNLLSPETQPPPDGRGSGCGLIPGRGHEGAAGLFQPAARPPRRILPWFASLAFHAAACGAILMLEAGGWFEPEVDWRLYAAAEPIRLQLRDPIYLPADSALPRQPQTTRSNRSAGSAAARAAAAAQAAKSAPGRFRVPSRLELPAPREIAADAPVLLQPDFAARPQPLKNALPALAYWEPQPPSPARPQPKKFVVPGRKNPAQTSLALDVPPSLAVPNAQPVAADIAIAAPQTNPAPALPVPNSSSNPVRIRDNSKKVQAAASFDVQQGQPVNVLALGADYAPAKNVEIPKGLRNIPPAGDAGPSASAGAAATAAATIATGAATGATAAATTAAAAAGRTPGPERPVAGAHDSAAANPSAAAAHASAGPEPRPLSSADAAALAALNLTRSLPAADAAPAVTRIQHPTNGKFDVVIMHSAASDGLPDITGMLSGNPIYTVYLAVGDRREWLMEYCLPSHGATSSNPYQITIDDSGALLPPYPISTVIPNSILGQPHSRHIVLRGVLTAAGSFTDLKPADLNNPIARQVLPLLAQWRFRPAFRDKVPVDVEVLLVIPPGS